MKARLFIAIPVHGRVALAERCISTVRDSIIHGHDTLAIYGDGTELSEALVGCADLPVQGPNIGIEAQRRKHLQYFHDHAAEREWSHLYFTDADAPHDPSWRTQALTLQAENGNPLTCLYNTEAHVRLSGNTISDNPASNVIWRRVAPGISYLLTAEHVRQIMRHIDSLQNFDWSIPSILGSRCAVSRISYCSHIGDGGLHHPTDGSIGDVPLNPTPWLISKRAEIVAALK